MSQIKCYKLVTGEEVIGEVRSETSDHIQLKNVRVLAMQPTGQGQIGIAMIPWMFSSQDGTSRVNRDKIVGDNIEPTPKALEDAYLQQTTGIQIASGNDSQIRI